MSDTLWTCPRCGRQFKRRDQSHYCGDKPKTIDEYILQQDEDKQPALRKIRDILKNALPEATECITWSMPTYRQGKRTLQFAASKKHIGFYPGEEAVAEFREKLTDYPSNKGTIRIPYDRIDEELIAGIAQWCWNQNEK